jgi:hypothetical protein
LKIVSVPFSDPSGSLLNPLSHLELLFQPQLGNPLNIVGLDFLDAAWYSSVVMLVTVLDESSTKQSDIAACF